MLQQLNITGPDDQEAEMGHHGIGDVPVEHEHRADDHGDNPLPERRQG